MAFAVTLRYGRLVVRLVLALTRVTGSRRDAADETVFALFHVHIKALGFDRQRRLDLSRAQETFIQLATPQNPLRPRRLTASWYDWSSGRMSKCWKSCFRRETQLPATATPRSSGRATCHADDQQRFLPGERSADTPSHTVTWMRNDSDVS
jgi:hypothetical protein